MGAQPFEQYQVWPVAASGFGEGGDTVVVGRWRIPVEFTVAATGTDLPYDVQLDATATRDGVEWTAIRATRRPGGDPVTAAGLRRVPLGRLKRIAIGLVAMEEFPGAGGGLLNAASHTQATRDLLHEQRRWRMTPEHLRAVAAAFRSDPRRGVVAVQREFTDKHRSIPYATAERWVRVARERGHLDPAGSTTNKRKGKR